MENLSAGMQAMLKSMKKARTRRARALRLYEAGNTLEQVAKIMGGVTRQNISRLVIKARAERNGK